MFNRVITRVFTSRQQFLNSAPKCQSLIASQRFISTTPTFCCQTEDSPLEYNAKQRIQTLPDEIRAKIKRGVEVRTDIPWELSAQYVKSEAFRETYGDQPVWKSYRRNHKGTTPPNKPRLKCINTFGVSKTGNPCPVCRDEYLVIDHRNVDVLKQFLCSHSGDVLPIKKIGLCRRMYRDLNIAVYKARDLGLLSFGVPHRKYFYEDYY